MLALELLEERQMLTGGSEAQYFVYLLNWARNDPAAFGEQFGLDVDLSDVAPGSPLAISDVLSNSATFHSSEMAGNDYFAQQSAVTGRWPNKIARDHGYLLPADWPDDRNFIQAITAGVLQSQAEEPLEVLLVDEGNGALGNRDFLLGIGAFNAANREIGVGYALNAASTHKHYWSIHIAREDPADRFLTGVVYADANANNRFDPGEGIPNVVIQAANKSVFTNAAGGWSIKVPDGKCVVTANGGGFQGSASGMVELLGENIEVDFVSGRSRPTVDFEPYQNRTPLAADDTVAVTEDGSVLAEVLANDADSDGTLAAGSVTITQSPARGTAQVDAATGTIRYVPDRGFFGSDFLAYTVHDDEGAASNEATVSIIVQPLPPSPWQNPVNSMDVDDSGAVVPLDVLLIINVLNSRGVIELPHTPGEVPEPPPYFDPSGDYVVSALDVLVIINYLNANWSGEGEGAWEQAADAAAASAEMAAIVAVSPAQTTVVAIHHRQSREASADNLFAQLATPTPRVPNPKARSSASWEPMVADKLLGLDLDLLGPSS